MTLTRMNSTRLTAKLLLTLGLSSAAALAQAKPGHLDEVLRQMDASSAKFHSAEADFRYELYERVVRETTTQNGSTYVLKNGTKTQMAAKFTTPAGKFLDFRDGFFSMYDAGTNHLTTFAAGKNQSLVESFLTLGFGASGKDLSRAWTITDQGEESINGVNTAKLDLVPKDAGVKQQVTHILVWIDTARDLAMKQEFFLPSDDTKTSYFTNIHLNQNVDTKKYDFKTNKQTTKDAH